MLKIAWFAAFIGLAVCQCVITAETGDGEASPSKRRQYVERLTAALRLETAVDSPETLKRSEKPLLQWAWERNGFTDGQTYVWGFGGRPLAMGGAFLIPGERTAHYELVSISPLPLVCRHYGEAVWTPPPAKLPWWKFSEAPQPAASANARLAQMRALVRKIGARATMGPPRYAEGTHWDLRLLTTPIHRYSDVDQKVLDGAVFAMVMGTDPQLLLLLEAQQEDDAAAWNAAFAPLSGFELTATLGEKEIWHSPKAENGHSKDSLWHLSQMVDVAELFDAEIK